MAEKTNKLKRAEKLFNLKSFSDAALFAKKNFKDAGGVVLARNLEHVSSEVFTQEFPGMTFLQQGVVVNNEGGYATSIRKLKLQVTGGFKESGTNTNTTGKISLVGEDDTIPVFTLEGESDWSKIELEQASLENINLQSRYFEGHSELYNRKIDDLGYLGQTRTDGTQKTLGLLNYPFTATSATGAADTLTGQQLYDEFASLILDQWAGVSNVETFMADRVVTSDVAYNQLTKKFLNTNGTSMTVMAALAQNFPGVTIGLTTKAKDVGGASKTVAFSSNRRAMQMRIPVPLNISSVDERGFKFYVESYFGVAGLDIIEATAGRALTGL